MRATPFLSYPVDPMGPWDGLGRGVGSIEAMPAGPTSSGLRLFHIMGVDVPEEEVQALEQRMQERLHSAITVHYDRITRRWQAEALIEEARLQESCLGAPLAMQGFDVPWIHIEGRDATVRLLPAAQPDLYILHARLEKALGRGVSVSYLDFTEYQRWLRRLVMA